ncbi:MAG: FecR domain-containing protein [Candidatus Thiodiazotropha sp. (ex Dulcina madagascariensis)]|nr:FecR domain-containing protein [Candidatus Thiodiazotropha sp. (ex Dulcina madagascariensis)]
MRLSNDTLLRLDGNSTLTFTHIENKTRSILDLLLGAVHFISRTPKSLEVKTPYVNASIEGTEFVVRIKDEATDVTVFEGLVVASNKAGSIELTANQTGHAAGNQAPVRIARANPRDAVAWALYYPPLPTRPGPADALAQQTIGAIVRNRLDEAAELAKRSLAADERSAAAYMAQSYVDQARFNIPAALANSRKAAELAPQSALTQARLAEIWLMHGETQAAQLAATQAVSIDPTLSLAHTVLGFASLRKVDLDTAKAAFEKAISLDSAAPLPHLGLGLAKIRQGVLEAGREAIETAVLLDPNSALLRSYMGKAYYEEKRNGLAAEQFAMAKALDPNDPTAWFYDSILLQSVNRPVEALQAQQQAIGLNDNRGVYRSRQLLDQDEAARSVALGRIYSDLNFEQQARYQATRALAQDPGNHSAHRLLADSYSGITNLDAARQSELLQSKMTQPLNLDPLQPQLSNSNLGLLDGNGPGDLSYNEYNPLFTRNGLALQLDASIAEKNTWSNDAIVAGLYDRFAFSLGQYHTETDGFRANAEYEQDIYNVFAQFALSDNTSLQIEVSNSEEQKGDVSQRLVPDFLNNNDIRISSEISTVRLGIRQALTVDTDLLISGIRRDQDFSSTDSSEPFVLINTDTEKTIDLFEAQITGKWKQSAWLTGVSHQAEDVESTLDATYSPPLSCPLPSCVFPTEKKLSQTRFYGYFFYQNTTALSLTGGLTFIKEKNEIDDDLRKIYPKVGLQLEPTTGNEIRLAAFRNRVSVILPSLYETLEPTQIVGFNQLPDDLHWTDSWNYAAAYNRRFSQNLHAGISSVYREMNTKIEMLDTSAPPPGSSIQTLEYDDTHAGFWLNWTPSMRWTLGIEYSYNLYNLKKGIQATDKSVLAPDGILKLETHKAPASVSFFHPSGFSTKLTATYLDQKGSFIDTTGFATQQGEDQGVITDIAFSYRFSKRMGSVSLGVNNLFDEHLNHEDQSSYDASDPVSSASPSVFFKERVVFGKISFNFR